MMNRNALVALQIRRGLIYLTDSGWRVLDRYAGVDMFDDVPVGFASEGEAVLALGFEAEEFADYYASQNS